MSATTEREPPAGTKTAELLAKLRQQLADERARKEAALEELQGIQQRLGKDGITDGAVFGKPSIDDARRLSHRVMDVLADLPDTARKRGEGAAALKIATNVRIDLAPFALRSETSVHEVLGRDRVRRLFLTHPGIRRSLYVDRPGRRAALELLANAATDFYFEPAFRRIYERSAERIEDSGAETDQR